MKTLCITLAVVALCTMAPAQTNQVISGTPLPQATPGQPGIPTGATIPFVVSSKPANGQRNVPWTTTKIEITFNEPMDVATFYWPLPRSADFPLVTRDPYWTNGNRTVVLPVKLNPTRVYRIPINTSSQIFRSAKGVAANPGVISFETGQASYGGTAKPSAVYGNRPFQGQTPSQPAGVGSAGSGAPATMGAPASPAGGQTGSGSQMGTGASGMQEKIRRAQQLRQNRGGRPTPTPTPAPEQTQ